MRVVHTNGSNKDFYPLCERLCASQNANVPGRKEAGLTSTYNLEKYEDVFLLYDGKKAIGSAGLWCHDERHCEVVRVFVDDDYRGQGLVGKVIGEVERLAHKKCYKSIYLRTWSVTPYAVRAYEKLGFKLIPAADFKYKDKFPGALLLSGIRVYMKKEL